MITKNFKLTIELIPSTVWYSSIYQFYKKSNQLDKWRELKEFLFETEGKKCWICGKETNYLQAHEFWEYDDYKHIQKLKSIHHVCDLCHKIKHIGFWCHSLEGNQKLIRQRLTKDNLIKHFCNVNNCSFLEFIQHEEEAFRIWARRSKNKWKQDFWLYDPKFNLKEIKNQQKINKFIEQNTALQ